MNIIKRTFFALLFTLFCIGYAYTQEYSVSLSGTFQHDSTSEGGLIDAMVFDGAGKASIHSLGESQGDFLQIGDTIVVYPDRSLFMFLKKDEQTLVGISMWVEGHVYRKMENDTIIKPLQSRGPDYATQLYEFYTLTGGGAFDQLSTYININTDSSLNTSMKRLCDEGLPKACIAMANALMLNSPALASLFDSSHEKVQDTALDKEIRDYYMKAIKLNEWEAITQLSSYLLMLGHQDEAKKILEEGCERGHSASCISLFGLGISSELED